jgi:diacylglycerol kinase (ATP)
MPSPFARSLRHATQGLTHTWRSQRNFRIEVGLGSLALLLAIWLGTGLAAVAIVVGLVLALELLNTALEAALDLLHPQQHPLVRVAKDCAAAAVLVASLMAVVVGMAELAPALLTKFCRVC